MTDPPYYMNANETAKRVFEGLNSLGQSFMSLNRKEILELIKKRAHRVSLQEADPTDEDIGVLIGAVVALAAHSGKRLPSLDYDDLFEKIESGRI